MCEALVLFVLLSLCLIIDPNWFEDVDHSYLETLIQSLKILLLLSDCKVLKLCFREIVVKWTNLIPSFWMNSDTGALCGPTWPQEVTYLSGV